MLRHGEIIRDLLEYVPTGEINSAGDPDVHEVKHPLMVVLSPECDLVSDYDQRAGAGWSEAGAKDVLNPKVLPHVQCCDLFVGSEIRTPDWNPYDFRTDLWRAVKGNQQDRYHWIPAEGIDELDQPDLFLDFKRIISVPTGYLYRMVAGGSVGRCGRIPPLWISRLVQRCYAFQGRICLPDPADTRLGAS